MARAPDTRTDENGNAVLTITVTGQMVGEPIPAWCPACLLTSAHTLEVELTGNGVIRLGRAVLTLCRECGYQSCERH